MTTGRINQVATIRLKPEAPKRTSTRFASVCGSSIASLHQFRNCLVPLLRPSACAPRSGNPLERRRRKDGLCCTSTVEFNSSSELRRGVLLDASNYCIGWLQNNHWSIQLQKRAQVIQGRTRWHSVLKQKKKSEPGSSLIKHLLDVTQKRKPATGEVIMKQRKEIKFQIINETNNDFKKYFFLFLPSASWV